jgi:hypothetical protein
MSASANQSELRQIIFAKCDFSHTWLLAGRITLREGEINHSLTVFGAIAGSLKFERSVQSDDKAVLRRYALPKAGERDERS